MREIPAAVLFDLDGTLVDTLDDITIVLSRVLVAHGFPPRGRAAVSRMVGDGARALVARAVDRSAEDPAVAALTAAYVRAYEDDPTPATRANPSAIELLDVLSARKIPAVVVTNKPTRIARVVVERTFGERVSAILGAGDTARLKPDPEPILAALSKIGVSPSREVWMIGDGSQDMAAARAAGVTAIAYRGGYGDAEGDESIGDFAELVSSLR
jgi:phosphoglycolate phosphatase